MQDKSAMYWQLLHNEKQLTALQQSSSIADFVQQIADYLQWPNLTFEMMLSFLEQQNKTRLVPELELFSRFWQPTDYRKNNHTLDWVPAFEPLHQPFYKDDILAQRGKLLAQFIRPATLVSDLLLQINTLAPVRPDLIIFHWSRCGSTLLGGLYRQLSGVKLLSESMLISDLLLDSFWPDDIKPQLLKLALKLQGRFRHGETQLVLKLNAWDLQYWRLWLQQFPDAKVLCLGRDPAAILASNQRISGMHMASVQGVWQQLDPWLHTTSLLQGRINVLHILMNYTDQLLGTGRANFLDYKQLEQLLQHSPQRLADCLARELTAEEQQHWLRFSKRNAKQPELFFQASQTAQQLFTAAELQQIEDGLNLQYLAIAASDLKSSD